MIHLNTDELKTLLAVTPALQNIMLVGAHGIGKSQILTNHFESMGLPVVALFLGQMCDPGDLLGLPTRDPDTGRTVYAPPYWFPLDDKPIVLFLDELNRARPEILQTVMDLTLNRKIGEHRLPAGSRVIAACNEGEQYQLTDLDPALVSRFNIYRFSPSPQEWLLWATAQGLDNRVIIFIEQQPTMLDFSNDTSLDQGMNKSPDRRAWEKVARLIEPISELTDVHKKIVAGIVGNSAAAALFLHISQNLAIDGADVLSNYKKVREKVLDYKLHQLSTINESLCRFIETNHKDTALNAKEQKNLKAYLDDLRSISNEAYAHMVTILLDGPYPNTLKLIVRTMPDLYQQMIEFVNDI